MKNKTFSSLGDILSGFDYSQDKYISREFQKYGYDLAVELEDLKNKSLYIKLAKTTPRALLENAKNFVKGSYQPKSKARLFMWRLQQLKVTNKMSHTRGAKAAEPRTLMGKSSKMSHTRGAKAAEPRTLMGKSSAEQK